MPATRSKNRTVKPSPVGRSCAGAGASLRDFPRREMDGLGPPPEPKRNGGRHRCQPPLRRAKDMPVFATLTRGSVFDPGSPAQASPPIVFIQARRAYHPAMFRGPSWDHPSLRPALSFPYPKIRSEPRRAREEDLFRRLSRLALVRPESLAIACRRRSVLWHPAAASCRCRLSEEAGAVAPITNRQ